MNSLSLSQRALADFVSIAGADLTSDPIFILTPPLGPLGIGYPVILPAGQPVVLELLVPELMLANSVIVSVWAKDPLQVKANHS